MPYLTQAGVTRIEQNQQRWNNRVSRDRAARDSLLAWLHDQRDAPQGSVPLARFLLDPRSALGGHFFTLADLDAAGAYLSEKGLIRGTAYVDQQRSPVWAQLSVDGIDCMEQGGNVAEYLTPRPGGVIYNFNAPLTGTNIAVGDNASQHATVNGIDADSLRTLMTAIIQALPSLGLDATDHKDVERTANEVIYESEQHQADPSRLRSTLTRLRSALAPAAKQSLSAVLNALIDYERQRIGLPPAQ